MAYTYSALILYTDSDGRFANLTGTPTVTAFDLAGNAISSPTITNLATGVYKVEVTQNDLEDVLFRVVPHDDDLAAFPDVAVMQDKVYHVADNIKAETALIVEDTGTTIPDLLSTTGVVLTAAGVDAILDEVVVGTYTMRQLLKVMAAAMAGKATGGGTTTITFRGVDDISDVIVATVDANGNRSAVTLTV